MESLDPQIIVHITELVEAGPLHLASARPLCRLKAPLGLSLLCKREVAAEVLIAILGDEE